VGAGYITLGERRYILKTARVKVEIGGGGARLELVLEPKDARRLWRRLAGRRRARATISVVATDTAGNSAQARLPSIGLRR
jgi:hypothetical protein